MILPEEQTCTLIETRVAATKKNKVSENYRRHTRRSFYLGKASVDEQVENTTKELISHKDGKIEIPNYHRTRVFDGIWEMT